MKRGIVTRSISIIVLMSIAALILLAIAQLGFGVALDDAVRRGSDLLTARLSAVTVEDPIAVPGFPGVIIASGSVLVVPSGDQRAAATVKLLSPVIDITMPTAETGLNNSTISAIGPTQFGASEVDKVSFRDATFNFRWSGGNALTVSKCNAELAGKASAALTFVGYCSYLGQPVAFEIWSSGRTELDKRQLGIARWPLKLSMTSPLLSVVLDGELDARGNWSLKSQADVRTPDTTLLAQWLGYGWGAVSNGPAVRIKGPLSWELGSVAFGKSSITLNDQPGIGAISLSFRGSRPIVEATVSFNALDVAPLLYVGASAAPIRSAALPASLEVSAPPARSSAWRGLVTRFPAIAHLDTEFRLSTARLQWRGEPIGQGAFSVSARNGEMHADFSELTVGSLSGSLQIETKAGASQSPVTLRGRFKSTNTAALTTALFGAEAVTGASVGQFELTGEGATLGAVIDRASGRGLLEAHDGAAHLDLAAVQRLLTAPINVVRPLLLSTIASLAPFEALALKFQVRDGEMSIESGSLRSNGILAAVTGRIGPAIDVKVRLDPSRLTPVKRTADRGGVSAVSGGSTLVVGGTWASPTVAVTPPDPLP